MHGPFPAALDLFFFMPKDTEDVSTGRVISTDTNTGTCEEVNQNSASRINETTGVALIILIGSFSTASAEALKPEREPRSIEIASERPNAIKVLVSV